MGMGPHNQPHLHTRIKAHSENDVFRSMGLTKFTKQELRQFVKPEILTYVGELMNGAIDDEENSNMDPLETDSQNDNDNADIRSPTRSNGRSP